MARLIGRQMTLAELRARATASNAERNNLMAALYRDGFSMNEIGAAFDLDVGAVHHALAAAGVTMRNRSKKARRGVVPTVPERLRGRVHGRRLSIVALSEGIDDFDPTPLDDELMG